MEPTSLLVGGALSQENNNESTQCGSLHSDLHTHLRGGRACTVVGGPAPLSQLSIRPIKIPTYRNERIRSFADWLRDNEHALTEYYNAVRPYCEGEPLVDYFEFVSIQHEREELKLLEVAL